MATRINREALRQRIKELAGLSDDERAALLELVNSKKYGLVWENHPEEVEERLRTHLPVLDEVPERYIPGTSASSPNHILIEGDNLEALTALTYTHEGRIDVIYIDPPYNTGNKDFSYNDHYVDADDDYRHSKWLSFMSKRLRIAKRLLSDQGVIFISIDDNEQANLKLLCDEVFGEDKFVGEIIWFKKRKGSFLSNTLISLTEYILPYTKTSDIKLFGGKPDNNESQPIIKRTNAIKKLHFDANIVRSKLSTGFYEPGVYGVGTSASTLHNRIEVQNGYIITPFDISAPFTWSQEFLEQEIKDGTDIFINTKNFQVRVIRHNNTSTKAIESYIDGREIGATNEDAYEQLKDIFATDRPFPYSKPVNLIKKLILSATYQQLSSTILDFFAGSGTTLHATMQLNKEDGGHRQCILVTNNENKICEEVTYERNRRVIQGYTTPKGVEVEGLTDNSLRYYRTRLLPRQRTNRNMRDLMAAATDLLCIKEDIFEELRIQNLEIRNIRKHVRLFGKGDRLMMVIYSEEAIPRIVEWLKTTPPLPSSEGWPKAGVCSNEGWPKAGVATKITLNLSEPTPNPSPGGDAAAPPAPIDATTTIPPAPLDATTAAPAIPSSEGWPKAGVCSSEGWPKAGVAIKITHNLSEPTPNPSPGGDAAAPPAPLDATTAAPAIPSSEGWPKAGVCSSEGWPKAGVCSSEGWTKAGVCSSEGWPKAGVCSSEGWPKAGVCSSEGWTKAGVCSNPIKVYTFSYTNYAYDDDFAEVEERVQLCALPAAIYEAYRRVLPQEDRYYDNEIIDGSDINEGKEDNQ